MRRYTALLTDKQVELLSDGEGVIFTVPQLAAFYDVSPASIAQRLYTLEARGLMARNPGWTWPTEWMVTDAGREAIELAENDTGQVLAPSA